MAWENKVLKSIYFLISEMVKFIRFKFVELQKLIKSIKYLGLFSPIIRFWFSNIFIYTFFYPVIKIFSKKEKSISICELFIKSPPFQKFYSFPSLTKNKIIVTKNEEWSVFIETYLRDTYHKDILKEGITIVDIGAHIGMYTTLAAEKIGKKGKIIAIEPEIKNYNQLLKNIDLNGLENITPVRVALSDHSGYEKLYISSWSGSHSLLSNVNETSLSIKVEVKTLDKLLEELNIKKIDVIKIDTEGAELPILKGAKETLKNNPNIKLLIASYHYRSESKEVLDFLQKLEFKAKICIPDFVVVL